MKWPAYASEDHWSLITATMFSCTWSKNLSFPTWQDHMAKPRWVKVLCAEVVWHWKRVSESFSHWVTLEAWICLTSWLDKSPKWRFMVMFHDYLYKDWEKQKKLDPKLVPERAQHSGGKMWREVNRPYFFFHSRALRKFDVTQPRPAYQVWPAATVWYMKNFVYHWFPCFVTALFIAKAMASKWVETWYRNGV